MVGQRKNCIRKKSKKLITLVMTTKEKLADQPKPDSYFRPDISIKVRRSLARRRSHLTGVTPLAFTREGVLSPLYKKDDTLKYINQVFRSVFKIGQGCFGDVYHAQSKEDYNFYAIKVTNDTHTFVDRDEVHRWEKIPPNDNCVKFFAAWQESFRIYIQMELCKTSLDKYLLVHHQINERSAWEIFTDISKGLQYLHLNELIHLDLKPANVMISADGVCKIGDFGLVVDLREVEQSANKKPVFRTVSEGDGKYVALEVLCNQIYTKAADIFSLGLLMLETVSDVALPKSGPHWVQIREGVIPVCYYDCILTMDFRNLIERMLLKAYENRPTISDILNHPSIQNVLALRQSGQAVNIMASWDDDYAEYSTRNPCNLDLPAMQVDGPSPPRRTYPINYISPLEPRVPLKEINMGDQTLRVSEEHYVKARSVARRLF